MRCSTLRASPTTAIGEPRWSSRKKRTDRLLSECKEAHLTPANLQPMCQSRNSSKGGKRDLDGEMRDHNNRNCPNKRCKERSFRFTSY
jgi:hypothetical protein